MAVILPRSSLAYHRLGRDLVDDGPIIKSKTTNKRCRSLQERQCNLRFSFAFPCRTVLRREFASGGGFFTFDLSSTCRGDRRGLENQTMAVMQGKRDGGDHRITDTVPGVRNTLRICRAAGGFSLVLLCCPRPWGLFAYQHSIVVDAVRYAQSPFS